MERPKFNEAMRKELAQIMGKIVFDWCNGDTDLEQCIEDSDEVLKYNYNDDGYTIAKELDDKGYSPDTMLVEELDCISNEKSVIEKKYVGAATSEGKILLPMNECC